MRISGPRLGAVFGGDAERMAGWVWVARLARASLSSLRWRLRARTMETALAGLGKVSGIPGWGPSSWSEESVADESAGVRIEGRVGGGCSMGKVAGVVVLVFGMGVSMGRDEMLGGFGCGGRMTRPVSCGPSVRGRLFGRSSIVRP